MSLAGITLEFGLFVGWKEACTTQVLVCLLIRCDPSFVFEKVFGNVEFLVDYFSLVKS